MSRDTSRPGFLTYSGLVVRDWMTSVIFLDPVKGCPLGLPLPHCVRTVRPRRFDMNVCTILGHAVQDTFELVDGTCLISSGDLRIDYESCMRDGNDALYLRAVRQTHTAEHHASTVTPLLGGMHDASMFA